VSPRRTLASTIDLRNYRAFGVEDDDAAFEAAANDLMPPGESRVWNNAIMELGGVARTSTPRCDEAGCPWRAWCDAYRTGDFTAPDVPTQPSFEGSRRQFRGRVVRTLGEHGREWLRGVLVDLADDGLVEVDERGDETVARLRA
jgi:A/G-specific adenine glycosylase